MSAFFRSGPFQELKEEFFAWNQARAGGSTEELARIVAEILAQVKGEGLDAVKRYTRKFDLAPDAKYDPILTLQEGAPAATENWQEALTVAKDRILAFHQRQLEHLTKGWTNLEWTHHEGKSSEGQRLRPVRRAGVYVPGGRAEYPSSVLMNVGPAIAAGVDPKSIVVATPPRQDGTLSPAVEYACRLLGVNTVLLAGGAQAIALLAYGCAQFPAVDVIVGPGNSFVNEAKRQVWGRVGLDNFAGPSEVGLWLDETANLEWAALDLLTQIEHAPDNTGLVVVPTQELAQAFEAVLSHQLELAPRKQSISLALSERCWLLVEPDTQLAAEAINLFAPEHLGLHLRDAESVLDLIHHAGCILVGGFGAQSAGDYILGPSHTLPTNGGARFGSPVNVMHFMRFQSISRVREDLVESLYAYGATIGDLEGFPTHAQGLRARL